ncbi:hypothetical protein O0I10_004870 [Lichtheimia ornata]|uniref:DNA primase n=1 Tax=Lichtheimia ornata TaxID=688661 RepID=A0AAD7V735_9FUNG|nr:uncharacterized protein O0I10_004870 [Lichtheimia ornata]KAJ8659505.1 hypothetical protein O0I10_004870 [Lichtheimia ornata]
MTETHKELEDVPMDLFDDDFEDGMDTDQQPNNTPLANKTQSLDDDPVFLLRLFYQRFFPYKQYFHWLNYGTDTSQNFTHREFSFTLPSDIYIRYNSFQDIDVMKKEIERLQPVKIDIGAVYSVKPKDKKTVNEKAFIPKEKELVFDIDMTDYDEIRTCCSGGDICHKCWEFMTIAIKVIDASLRQDFGFKHIMWVYSGRRGVHCWVSDERARRLNNESRKAIVGFLEVIKGGAESARKVKLPATLHPSLGRSLDILKPYFGSLLLEEQGILDKPESWEKVLNILPDAGIREELNTAWSEDPSRSGEDKWQDLLGLLTAMDKKKKRSEGSQVARDIVFQYSYPRLDDKVSVQINHLLKSPFCVHPKTQRVCVPIKVEDCDSFDPLGVPTLSQLAKELNEYDQKHKDNTERKIPDYKKTSLRPYIETFEKFVNSLMIESQKIKRDIAQNSMEF